jgi:hypothetical protein
MAVLKTNCFFYFFPQFEVIWVAGSAIIPFVLSVQNDWPASFATE